MQLKLKKTNFKGNICKTTMFNLSKGAFIEINHVSCHLVHLLS